MLPPIGSLRLPLVAVTCPLFATNIALSFAFTCSSLIGKGLKAKLNPARLSASLPDTLIYFSLANNDITGSLSAQWGPPATLEFLDLSGCKLAGSIPQDWEPLLPKRLFQIFLHGNQLSGEEPGPLAMLLVL